MFVLNVYFCRELRFVGILRSKLRLLLRNTGVDSDFTQNFWVKNWRLKALDNTFIDLENLVAKLCMSDSQRFLSELIPHSFVWGQPEPRQVLRDLWRCKNISHSEIFVCHIERVHQQVDHDYVVEASKLLHNSGCPDLHLLTSQVFIFCHLKESGHGFNTDIGVIGHSQGSNPDSFFLYPSTKGKAEEAVK